MGSKHQRTLPFKLFPLWFLLRLCKMSTSSEPEVVIYGLQNYQQIVEAWREIVTNGYRSPAVVTLLTGFRETPACEGCCHNANCFSGITPEVLAYFYLRSTGEIAERPDYEWGCKHPDLIFGRDRIFRSQVQIEFQEVDWNKGFTCRGCMCISGTQAF